MTQGNGRLPSRWNFAHTRAVIVQMIRVLIPNIHAALGPSVSTVLCWRRRRSYYNSINRLALEHARAALAAGADDATTLATAGFVIGLVEHDYERDECY